jgi:thioredoxin 1
MSEFVSAVTDETFDQEVLQSKQPVLVDFWAEWCGPCRALAPAVDAVAKDYTGKAKVVKLNVDDSPNVPSRYGIRGIPTLILFKGGDEADRVIGMTSKENIARMIDRAIDQAISA